MQIVENDFKYLDDFIRLNEEWITRYFKIEELDKALAAKPSKIILDGGFIFTLLDNDKPVGVCALFNVDNDTFELARMAVCPKQQGKGLGNILIQACLSKLKAISAKRVYLVSNTKLEPAINLYKKHGFSVTSLGQHPVYKRANIVMEQFIS
jgi:N-acetylglutamate synthase-like GNAT family acetyltransferase